MYFDTHSHLEMVIREKNISWETILKSMQNESVCGTLNIIASVDELDFLESSGLMNCSDTKLFHAAGIHPHNALNYDKDISWIYGIKEKIIAVGECGMDLYYDFSDEISQEKLLRKMAELSLELKKPIIIHGREAESKIVDYLKSYGVKGETVLFHCFTGNEKSAEKVVDFGASISFSGIITFKNSSSLRDVLKNTPINKIMFETDSPFLAPIPFRGAVNTPDKVRSVYKYAASFLNLEEHFLAETVKANINNFFSINI